MRKFSIVVLAIILSLTVTGCVGTKVESKTCTMDEVSGIKQSFNISATNGEVDKLEIHMTFNNSLFGVSTLSTLSESQKETIKKSILQNLGLEKESYEGLEIIVNIEDQMTITVKADTTKADPAVLKKIGMDLTGADMSFDRAISDMEKAGATCK